MFNARARFYERFCLFLVTLFTKQSLAKEFNSQGIETLIFVTLSHFTLSAFQIIL